MCVWYSLRVSLNKSMTSKSMYSEASIRLKPSHRRAPHFFAIASLNGEYVLFNYNIFVVVVVVVVITIIIIIIIIISVQALCSFFLCLFSCFLMQELNTAEDFISFYEEIMPFVQTLSLIILHKELIFSKLISRLRFEARLSLEPILRYAI